MTIRISRALLAQIIDAAAASPEREICGLLIGQEGEVRGVLPAANAAADPATRFEIDPALLLRAQREARRRGDRVLGHYHSHPRGGALPSVQDAREAHGDGALWLLCTPAGDHSLWRAAGEGLHGQFVAVELCVE